ncbi:MAG: ATP-binding protein [Pseudodesulfovibrio sp.]|jgi:PAS domain S-box-containing protein|uniref:histidine kinase n=1 Tax=Pseudodesulfovibrio indicus TaxID=1716143 RepID=A0A126QQN3_9BACT|nr:ATP-binding protein [Pseudodesulfovibrio indicus]AMK12056.1 PAS domain-containing sensor histidine kinase [Pseudodesulfovibrio indicus]TDT88656.1 PAS domain S-box-containing protein [Pseudodesulfovibrio indicus]
MNLQNYYDTVMELTHGIVVTLDLNGGIIHGNSELETLSGYHLKELAGRDWFEVFIPRDEREMARRALFESAHGQGISAFAGRIRAKDGDIVYVNWNLKPLTDSNGEVISLLCVGQDVTDLVLREKGLLRERFTLMERNKELSCLYSLSQLMGEIHRTMDDLLGHVVALLPSAFQHPDMTYARLRLGTKIYETPGYAESDFMLRSDLVISDEKRGSLSVAVRGYAPRTGFLEDEKDLFSTVVQQVVILVSKRETRLAKQELERQLRQSDRLAKIGQFSAGVAHEINEPLANILGFAELALQTPDLPDQVVTDLNNIVDSSLHAREIIRKLMFFGRQLPPQPTHIDLNDTVDQALRITEAGSMRGDIVIVREFDPELPRILADPQHIKQVVVNLVVNAIQAMAHGGTVTIRTLTNQSDVYLIVEDTGPGMTPDVLKMIFTPFFTTKDVDKGSGLGLSVIHGIVKAHGGFIQVHSAPDEGTRVEVAFPCHLRGPEE